MNRLWVPTAVAGAIVAVALAFGAYFDAMPLDATLRPQSYTGPSPRGAASDVRRPGSHIVELPLADSPLLPPAVFRRQLMLWLQEPGTAAERTAPVERSRTERRQLRALPGEET